MALLGLLMAVWCMRCRVKTSKPPAVKPAPRPAAATTATSKGQQLEMNALLPKAPVRAREFPMQTISFHQELGEGAFGKVYKGEVNVDGCVTQVAIKTLKENATAKTQQDFRREVDMMTDLRHPNIICLLGVCVKEEPMCMLFEYMSHGDLHEFLIMHSPRSDISAANSDDGTVRILESSDFLRMATQIAHGMEYLASHHYIHRDLATRNCLVGDQLTVKISDFGLSRDIYSSDYYRVQSKSLLPVRWMPPESILYGKFTTDSDIWSFGVVLWEVYSYGLQPYYGYSNQEVIDMIRNRQLLPCPEECPPHLYALMVECWHEVPARRPTFKEIHSRLRSWENVTYGGVGGGGALHHNLHAAVNNAANVNTLSTSHSTTSTHNSGSQHSSTGPSNNTGSSYLSNANSQGASPYQRALMAVAAQGLVVPPAAVAQQQLQQALALANNQLRPSVMMAALQQQQHPTQVMVVSGGNTNNPNVHVVRCGAPSAIQNVNNCHRPITPQVQLQASSQPPLAASSASNAMPSAAAASSAASTVLYKPTMLSSQLPHYMNEAKISNL